MDFLAVLGFAERMERHGRAAIARELAHLELPKISGEQALLLLRFPRDRAVWPTKMDDIYCGTNSSYLLRQMREAGLLRRSGSYDGRVKPLHITPLGIAIADRLKPLFARFDHLVYEHKATSLQGFDYVMGLMAR